MKKRITISLGLALLVVGCFGFLGCNGGAGGVQSTQALISFQTPNPALSNSADIQSAVVKPTITDVQLSTLGPMTFFAPFGYTLSFAVPRGRTTAPTSEPIQFNFTGIDPAASTLTLAVSNGNLVTSGIAVLPVGQVSMTFPTVVLTPVGQSSAQNQTLTFTGMTVVFTVKSNGQWTLPQTLYLSLSRLSSGYYEIDNTFATAVYNHGQTIASSCALTGLELIKGGTVEATLSKTFFPSGNTITITGKNAEPVDTLADCTFTFNP